MKRGLLAAGVMFFSCAMTWAENPHTPPANSPERKAMMDTLRVPFERELKQKVKFEVSFFKVQGEWAFVMGTPENAQTGKAIHAFPEVDPNFCALLRKRAGGEWTVVDHSAGFGDPFYASWVKQHHAPLAIFPDVVATMQGN